MQIKRRKVALGFFMLVAFLSIFVFTPHVSAAIHVNTRTESLFPLKGCAVTHVILHGMLSPSVTCSQLASASSSVSPFTGVTNCSSQWNLGIRGAEGNFCFSGTGYMAIRITHLVAYYTALNGWLRMYPSGSTSGFFYNIDANSSDSNSGYFNSHYDITQVCDGCGLH